MKNRWIVALAGTVVMICLGTVYAWSTFTQPLIAAFGWTNTTTTWTFSLTILFLGIGSVIGGRWQDQSGPRPVVVTGAILWGVGNILAGLGTARFGAWWIYLTYGLIGGIGLGLGYITPVAVVTKWFPDMRGLAHRNGGDGVWAGCVFLQSAAQITPRGLRIWRSIRRWSWTRGRPNCQAVMDARHAPADAGGGCAGDIDPRQACQRSPGICLVVWYDPQRGPSPCRA